VWDGSGLLWYVIRSGPLTIQMSFSPQNPSKDKGTDPSRGVCPLMPRIVHVFAIVNA
jgi:hypothetical protein